jgi:hypothetical protein
MGRIEKLKRELIEESNKRILKEQTANIAGQKFLKAAKGVGTDEKGMLDAIRSLKSKNDFIAFNNWLKDNSGEDFKNWIYSEFSAEEELITISTERNDMIQHLKKIGVKKTGSGRYDTIDRLFGHEKQAGMEPGFGEGPPVR